MEFSDKFSSLDNEYQRYAETQFSSHQMWRSNSLICNMKEVAKCINSVTNRNKQDDGQLAKNQLSGDQSSYFGTWIQKW